MQAATNRAPGGCLQTDTVLSAEELNLVCGGSSYDPVAGTIILDHHVSSFADLEVERKLREIIESVPKFDLANL